MLDLGPSGGHLNRPTLRLWYASGVSFYFMKFQSTVNDELQDISLSPGVLSLSTRQTPNASFTRAMMCGLSHS